MISLNTMLILFVQRNEPIEERHGIFAATVLANDQRGGLYLHLLIVAESLIVLECCYFLKHTFSVY